MRRVKVLEDGRTTHIVKRSQGLDLGLAARVLLRHQL
jgi:hypothetical protein